MQETIILTDDQTIIFKELGFDTVQSLIDDRLKVGVDELERDRDALYGKKIQAIDPEVKDQVDQLIDENLAKKGISIQDQAQSLLNEEVLTP